MVRGEEGGVRSHGREGHRILLPVWAKNTFVVAGFVSELNDARRGTLSICPLVSHLIQPSETRSHVSRCRDAVERPMF